MGLNELRTRRIKLKEATDTTFRNMQRITDESFRVLKVAQNSEKLIKDLDREFEEASGLQGNDVVFLFTAVGLQLVRIMLINNLTKIENAGGDNATENKLKDIQNKILGKFKNGGSIEDRPYYASMAHIITRIGVPYDATAPLTADAIHRLSEKGREWSYDLGPYIPEEKVRLFKGSNHRFSTLGHDPLLGLLFGTSNILTNTITCVKEPVFGKIIGPPVLTTNHVVYTADYKDPRIGSYASTVLMLKAVTDRIFEQPSAFVAALIKQILHIGTDLYTPCGIQIPASNLVMSNEATQELTKYISMGDLVKIGTSAKIAELINFLISTVHTLMYDSSKGYSRDVYNVRTRKIILYSNMIATGSNVLWVGINASAGNETAIKDLDIGGLIVIIQRLMTDVDFIQKVKEEFVLGGFKQMIRGDTLVLEEAKWD